MLLICLKISKFIQYDTQSLTFNSEWMEESGNKTSNELLKR